jgi:hypothetical protein
MWCSFPSGPWCLAEGTASHRTGKKTTINLAASGANNSRGPAFSAKRRCGCNSDSTHALSQPPSPRERGFFCA